MLAEGDYRPMSKTGRNESCPCGSGKKYKRCCWRRDREAASQTATAANAIPPSTPWPWVVLEDDELNELSNEIVFLLGEGRIEDAEQVWEQLNRKHPDEIDPLHRKAMILEARGHYREAALYYRRTAQYTRTHEGFEPEATDHFEAKADELHKRRES